MTRRLGLAVAMLVAFMNRDRVIQSVAGDMRLLL